MKNKAKYIILSLISTFIFMFNVNAECSYQERKELLNAAKNVDVFFTIETEEKEFIGINPNTDEEMTYMKEYNYFKLNLIGLTNNLFVKIINNKNNEEIIVKYEDLIDGKYTLRVDNTMDIINYYIFYYSLNNKCFAENIYKKTVKKPKENSVYFYSVCSNELVTEHEYCKQFINKDFKLNEYEIVNKLNDIIEETKKTEVDRNVINILKNFIFNNWYYFIIFIVIIIIIIIIKNIRKKRNTL